MEKFSRGLRVQIFCGESDQSGHRPLYLAIVELLRREGAAGVTVTRGIAGFGRDSIVKTASVLRLSLDLPIVITWVDAPERVDRLLPSVREMAASGVITVEEVGIASYGERAVGRMRFDLQILDVMSRPARSVRETASVRDAVEALLGRPFRALPVVDDAGRLVGVVSNGDLVARAGLGARIELLNVMTDADRGRFLDALPDRPVREVMTGSPVTIRQSATLAQATKLLGERGLKRLPVVDAAGMLVGMLSRADVLRAVAEAFPRPETGPATAGDGAPPRAARDVMRPDGPVVSEDAELPAVVDAVCSTRLNRAVVVDERGAVVGIVSDAAVLEALGPDGHGVVGSLMGKVGVGHAPVRKARELMTEAYAVPGDAPLAEVARIMTEHRRKMVPVVDGEGRLLGVIDRADVLAATRSALGGPAIPPVGDEAG